MANLHAFQRAAVERILERFRDPKGTRRFLLADEVGLGKTMITRGVIDAFRQEDKPQTVLYICSNQEIAAQNRDKLAEDSEAISTRLTLLGLEKVFRDRARRFRLLSFTPGTSLNLSGGTGQLRERLLLLHLADRMGLTGDRSASWESFFRCGCGEDAEAQLTTASLEQAFSDEHGQHLLSDGFVEEVRRQWSGRMVKPRGWRKAGVDNGGFPLLAGLTSAAEEWLPRNEDTYSGTRRNAIIGQLRIGLALATLGHLDASLIICDEFQRFREVLNLKPKANPIVDQLLSGDVPVLLLSATPYKMFALSIEEERHSDFLNTLSFLYRKSVDEAPLSDIQAALTAFEARLRVSDWAADGPDHALLGLRDRIQRGLADVMSRTERNWYLEDMEKGLEEVADQNQCVAAMPTVEEVRSYVDLKRCLASLELDNWTIMDFWKSSPAPLLFMDGGYTLIKNLRRQKSEIAVGLVPRMDEATHSQRAKFGKLAKIRERSARLQKLAALAFDGGDSERRRRPLTSLWMRPTYTYHTDTFFGDEVQQPRKFLVFSHWRMVPKTVSVLLSHEAKARLPEKGLRARKKAPTPLNYNSFSPFGALWSCPSLAVLVDPLEIRKGPRKRALGSQSVLSKAVSILRKYLSRNGPDLNIAIGPSNQGFNRTIWKVVARLDAHCVHRGAMQSALSELASDRTLPWCADERVTLYQRWFDDRETRYILSEQSLAELAHIALWSPAVCVLRAAWSVLPESAACVHPALRFGLTRLQRFFHRRASQAVIRDHTDGGGYPYKIRQYCCDAHFQAVLDEFFFLLYGTCQRKDPMGAKGLFPQLARAMDMGEGTPQVNVLDKNRRYHRRGRQVRTQFARAFGEKPAVESRRRRKGSRRQRVSRRGEPNALRDAFNSPFWPNVLATTSVGQEGLDFHLYCRDIVHWNLPSNPVDLEQREGRINRFNSLFVRQNISVDFPLRAVVDTVRHRGADGRRHNIWDAVFDAVARRPRGLQRFKHGLYPNWIYRPYNKEQAQKPLIRRHLLFYSYSQDEQRYRRLKQMLASYRLAFGQPRQQDLVDDMLRQNLDLSSAKLAQQLSGYMVNLSPMREKQIRAEMSRHVDDILTVSEGLADFPPEGLVDFLDDLRAEVLQPHATELIDVRHIIDALIEVVSHRDTTRPRRVKALEALVYLANPYDMQFDFFDGIGFDDDKKELRLAYEALFGGSDSAGRLS